MLRPMPFEELETLYDKHDDAITFLTEVGSELAKEQREVAQRLYDVSRSGREFLSSMYSYILVAKEIEKRRLTYEEGWKQDWARKMFDASMRMLMEPAEKN